MSDEEIEVKPFAIERAKQGRASCKKCKNQCEAGNLRIAKVNANNPFGSGPMKNWYHLDCFFQLKKSKTAKSLERSDEIEGWDLLQEEEKKTIIKKAGELFKLVTVKNEPSIVESGTTSSFYDFQEIVKKVAEESSYNAKSLILRNFLQKGTAKGNIELWFKFLMPKDVEKRVYNLQDKQLVKLFSIIFDLDLQSMIDHLSEGGDVSHTIEVFFKKSKDIKPAEKSTLTLLEVDEFLDKLKTLTQETHQINHFKSLCGKCATADLKTIIRLIKHDLKMNCGARHVLDALHHEAYGAFQKSRDLKLILREFSIDQNGLTKSSSTGLKLMIPISPMLAEACKDFDKALKKCPEGFFSEIKYDGERVQIHKQGDQFKFFSRNLKPVLDHKVTNIREFLPKAFPHGNDLIIDSEILMVDTLTDNFLPFGTLGKHKKEGLQTAEVCLFIFDCLYFNGEDLTKKTIKERRKFLEDNVTTIKHHIQLSEYKFLQTKDDLIEMTKHVLKKNLEGLVLKGANTIYEPGKRRWLKVKKDYLMQGAIADTVDLVVLGAWFGTGKLGGLYSIFLMGCHDEKTKMWKTVTKVHSGLDDNERQKIHKKISVLMEKCNSDSKMPKWIKINRTMVPNAIALNPMKMPVFEITAAEFTKSDIHTAGSISVRFPRITKIRDDKSPLQATNLSELNFLYEESKSGVNLDELNKLKSKQLRLSEGNDIQPSTSSSSRKNLQDCLDTGNLKSFNSLSDKKKRERNVTDVISKKPKLSLGIYEGILLYVSDDKEGMHNNDLSEFSRQGGILVSASRDANLVLHLSRQIEASLEDLRILYNPSCQHSYIAWLSDSLKENKLKSHDNYSISIHQP